MKLLIESYYKFLKNRTKFYKSPLLNLDRYGFSEVYQTERNKGEKSIEIINKYLKHCKIYKGHIVYRIILDSWKLPHVVIYYNENILDKYGNKINKKHWITR